MGTDLDSLRERREELSLRREIAELEASQLLEAEQKRHQRLLEVGQVLGSRTAYLYDSPAQGFGTLGDEGVYGIHHIDRVDDRTEGRYRPIYETETELAQQRGIARVMAAVDEHAIGVIETLGNYTLGTGYEYEVSAKDEQSEPVAEICQQILDEFIQRPSVRWRRKEREYHNRSRRDGEPFLKLSPIGRGRADVEFVEPAEITEPNNANELSEYAGYPSLDWSMGVATEWGKIKALGYFRDMDGQARDWEYLPADRIVHGKRNVDERAKRGVSDFYAVWRDLERASKVLRNSGEGAALQAAIAFIREHVPGVGLAAVQQMNASQLTDTLAVPTPFGTSSRQQRFRRYPPGTVLDVPSGQQYKPGPMGAERNEGFVSVAQAIWRSAGMRWLMPDYMITGDPSNGSFASTLIAESPFVKAREADQVWYGEELTDVMWGVLDIALATHPLLSRLDIANLERLRELVTVNVEPPRVSVRNRTEDTQISAVLSQNGLMSDRTWAGKEDLDYDHEQAQIAEERPAKIQQAAMRFASFGGFGGPVGPGSGAGGLGATGEQPQPLARVGASNPETNPEPSMQESFELPSGEGYPYVGGEGRFWEAYP